MSSSLIADISLLDRLFHEELPAICLSRQGRLTIETPESLAIVSGSFNPLHHAHWKLAEVAAEKARKPTAFEMSILNVDKPPLSKDEVCRRLQQFSGRAMVWVTRARTFEEKAKLFPSATFAIGGDTAERLLLPRYYGNDRQRVLQALECIRVQGCRFFVAGRTNAEGRFRGLEDLMVPAEYADLFAAIPREEFDHPISSTQLRRDGPAAGLGSLGAAGSSAGQYS